MRIVAHEDWKTLAGRLKAKNRPGLARQGPLDFKTSVRQVGIRRHDGAISPSARDGLVKVDGALLWEPGFHNWQGMRLSGVGTVPCLLLAPFPLGTDSIMPFSLSSANI